MFVGEHRRSEVERLCRSFARVVRLGRPSMIVHIAPPGWGKTRIVQEFYRSIAAEQPAPPFWPPVIAPDSPSGDPVAGLMVARKAVRPAGPPRPPDGATLPWLWLAPAVGTLSDGSAAWALPGLAAQLRGQLAFAPSPAPSAGADLSDPARLQLWLANQLHQGRSTTDAAALPAVLVLDDAHYLDAATIELIAGLLAAELPILMIATTWPDSLGSGAPFPALLDQTRGSDRVETVHLGCLSTEDLVTMLLHEYPGTDPLLCDRLATRAGGNPYALRLLLTTPRVSRTVVDGRIGLPPDEVDGLSGRLDQLLDAHWRRLPDDTRQLLVAASLLGPAFLDSVLGAAIRRLGIAWSLDHALDTSWLRPFGGDRRLIEFCERLRFDVAAADAANVLSPSQQRQVREDALRATRALLPVEPGGLGRGVLLTLHLSLTRAGVETDLVAAADSAMELAELTRTAARNPAAIDYLGEAAIWLEKAGEWARLVECLVELAAAVRLETSKAASESVALRAVELAEHHLPPDDERRITAMLVLATARRRRRDTVAYESAGELTAAAAEQVRRLAAPSSTVRHRLWAAQLLRLSLDGDYAAAADGSRELLAFCERHFGPSQRRTLDVLSDLGFRLHRCRPDEAVVVRRELLARRQRAAPFPDDLRTASARLDLAVSLLATGHDDVLAEAGRLVDDALTMWSRVYGMDGPQPLRARAVRARVGRRDGLVLELAGDQDGAARRYRAAAAETRHVLALREAGAVVGDDAELALALQRHGESLAYLRDDEAVHRLDGALRIREAELRQDSSFWEVTSCAQALRWAFLRLSRPRDAAHVVVQYGLPPGVEPVAP